MKELICELSVGSAHFAMKAPCDWSVSAHPNRRCLVRSRLRLRSLRVYLGRLGAHGCAVHGRDHHLWGRLR